MNPPPPMPHDCGRATLRANTVAAAASTALPPRSSTDRPTRAAAGDSVATTPRSPLAGGRSLEPGLAWATDTPAANASGGDDDQGDGEGRRRTPFGYPPGER